MLKYKHVKLLLPKTILFNLFLLCSISGYAQQTVGLFTKNTGEQDGYVLFSPESSYITYLVDKCGKLVHKWNSGAYPGLHGYLLPNGEYLEACRYNNPYFTSAGSTGGLLQLFDWNGKLIWKYLISDSLQTQDHDIFPMPNGNIMVDIWERFTAAQAIAMGRNSSRIGGSDVWSVKLEEIKPIGKDSAQIVWQWRLWDHLIQDLDSTKPNYGVVTNHPELLNINYEDTTETGFGARSLDWVHVNAVTYNSDLDQIMISARSISEIWLLDHSTTTAQAASHSGGKHNKGGDLLYRWGNPSAYNRGTLSNKKLFNQHNPTWIPDGYPGAGKISIFNNGTHRPGGNFSSADIIVPPVDANGNYYLATGKTYGPDSAIWSYKAPNLTDFYSATEGGVQPLKNGNMLICEANKGNFFEVDSNKNIVWRYVDPDGGYGPTIQTYSPGLNTCFRANLYLENYPAFNNKTLKPGSPIEINPLSNSTNCYMPFVYYEAPLYKISQLTHYNKVTGVVDSLNRGTGFIKGVVESQNFNNNTLHFSLIDSTGAITVISSHMYYTPAIGDSILVSGTISQANGLIEYSSDSIITLKKGSWQKKPDVVAKMDESKVSDLITIKNVRMLDKSEWYPFGSGFTVHITNGIDTFVMLISNKTDLFKMSAPWEEFNVTGIETQNQPNLPYFGDYEIEPRGNFDIQKITQLYNISQVKVQNAISGVADSAGSPYPFFIKGIVQSPDFSSAGLNFSLKDSTGSIMVYSAKDINGYVSKTGDSIELRCVLKQVNGLTELVPDSIILLHSGKAIINPVNVSGLTENYEAQLIKLDNYYLADTSQWVPSKNGFSVKITNKTDTVAMEISPATDLFKMKALIGNFNISGIEIQDQSKAPYFGNYEIEPRGLFDFKRITPLYKIIQLKSQNSISGVADSAGSKNNFFIKGIVLSPNFVKSGYEFSIKDNTGSVFIYAPTRVSGYIPEVGDSIEIRGLLSQKNGVICVIPDTVFKLKYASPSLFPRVITSLDESTEAVYVKYTNARLIDITKWDSTSSDFIVRATNATDTIQLYISTATDIPSHLPPNGKFNISGIGWQAKTTLPYLGNYLLVPRSFSDFFISSNRLYKIRDIKNYNYITGIADSINTYCLLKGKVQSGNLSGTSEYEYAIQDSTGSITVNSGTIINGYIPDIGDSVLVRGTVLQGLGLTHFTIDSVAKLSTGQQISPVIVTSLSENTESELVTLNGYKLVDPSQWDTTGVQSSFELKINNAIDTITLKIVDGTDLFSNAARPTGTFDVTGIGSQTDSMLPYFSGYYLIPRSVYDFSTFHSSIPYVDNLTLKIEIYPNPSDGTINIFSSNTITNLELTDLLGKTIFYSKPDNMHYGLNLSGLSKGIYIAKIYNGTDCTIRKIVLK